MLERWPQVCRVKITFALLTTNRFVSTTTNSMKCLVNWILLRIRVRSTNTQLHLNTHTYYYTHTQIYAHIEQQQGAKCASNWALFRLMCVCTTHNHHCVCEGIKHTLSLCTCTYWHTHTLSSSKALNGLAIGDFIDWCVYSHTSSLLCVCRYQTYIIIV